MTDHRPPPERIDPDVAAFGDYMAGLSEAVEQAGANIRAGLEAIAAGIAASIRAAIPALQAHQQAIEQLLADGWKALDDARLNIPESDE